MITADVVKELRQRSGAGMMECKRALQEADGDLERALDVLRTKGAAGVAKRAGRAASEGLVESYVHLGGKIGVLIEVNCETDFVAKTDEFRNLARQLAMQVAATDPVAVDREGVPAAVVERERGIYADQARQTGKPDAIVEKIAAGKLEKFYGEAVLLEQPFIRDTERRVRDVVADVAAKLGENVVVRRFVRFAIGG
ncbi:MAG: translation elongation factor Ts [Gemmatimonadetes bacterium]|nr:translation elongation factor Ts [Gemmatimonadota bacterium]